MEDIRTFIDHHPNVREIVYGIPQRLIKEPRMSEVHGVTLWEFTYLNVLMTVPRILNDMKRDYCMG